MFYFGRNVYFGVFISTFRITVGNALKALQTTNIPSIRLLIIQIVFLFESIVSLAQSLSLSIPNFPAIHTIPKPRICELYPRAVTVNRDRQASSS